MNSSLPNYCYSVSLDRVNSALNGYLEKFGEVKQEGCANAQDVWPQPPIALPGWRAKKRRSAPPIRTVKSNAVLFTFLQVKRAVVTSLIDRALIIYCDSYINTGINFIRDIIFDNGFPIPFVNKIVNHRLKTHSRKIEDDVSQCEATDKPSNIIYLPYIPKITTRLKNICKKNNPYVVFTNNFKNINFLNSGKDKTQVTIQRGDYQIPCDSGNYYVGRTHQNLEKRLHQHKKDIDKALISNSSNNSFDSALGWYIFNNPSHTILFEKSSLITNDLGDKTGGSRINRN